MGNLFTGIKQCFCKHKFVKYYVSGCNKYVFRCAKCNKIKGGNDND